jgi:hypothetical protein
MTKRQEEFLINVGIEVGLTLAGLGIAAANQYIKANYPDAASITNGLKDIFNGARAILDPTAIDIEEIRRGRAV